MIRDPKTRADLARDWAAVKKLCHLPTGAQIPGGPYVAWPTPAGYYNLPFVLAYAVLDQVLASLIDEGAFPCPGKWPPFGPPLAAKMKASVPAVPWQEYALVDAGKTARNDLAHEAKLLDQAACFKYIDAIEAELTAWGVL